MKAFLVVLALLVVGIVGLGFYQGWFNLATQGGGAKSNITLSVDTDKFQEDRKAATKAVKELRDPEKKADPGP